ncbi:MAG: protein TonB [Flavobacteriaceae bacterium]|jgi:protein TonB
MKPTIFIICFLASFSLFAQEEWGGVDKNNVTLKEIAPVWPGCESEKGNSKSDCFDKNLIQHVIKNFKYPMSAYKNNVQGKVIVEFFINQEGMVEVKSVTGATKALQDEAKRNILAIPKMKPGMLGGKFREIKYTIPFTFKTGK